MDTKAEVANEIMVIADLFESGKCDTPGGLEHMGDVKRLFLKWNKKLQAPREEQVKPLTWTTVKPTRVGNYWWRNPPYYLSILQIDIIDGVLVCEALEETVEDMDGEWSSEPIAEPQEAS